MASKKDQAPKWISSDAKALLIELVKKGEVPADMKPKKVFETFCKDRPEFKLVGDANFASRLKGVRDKIKDKNFSAERDAAALAHDRMLHPRPHEDGFGLPFWPDAEAKKLLDKDIDNNLHNTMTKTALWKSRAECYECFPFEIFVKRIHQEVKTRKFHAHCEDKANKKISKKDIENIPSNVK